MSSRGHRLLVHLQDQVALYQPWRSLRAWLQHLCHHDTFTVTLHDLPASLSAVIESVYTQGSLVIDLDLRQMLLLVQMFYCTHTTGTKNIRYPNTTHPLALLNPSLTFQVSRLGFCIHQLVLDSLHASLCPSQAKLTLSLSTMLPWLKYFDLLFQLCLTLMCNPIRLFLAEYWDITLKRTQ